jgi:gliding motility-associated lipoprotein GldD
MGYFRIDFPPKKYQTYKGECPFSFDYPLYARVIKSDMANAEPCWLNVEFPQFNAKVHLSYKYVSGNINEIIEECHTLAYKHAIKADAIDEKLYIDSANKVFGMLYEIKGNAASSIQFYVSDSTKNFLRGALYFNVRPNKDSLAPVIDFIEQDITQLMETLRWK